MACAETTAPDLNSVSCELGRSSFEPSEPEISRTRFQRPVVCTRSAKIMIVDDEQVNVKVVRKYLQGFGYEKFVTETDSLRALELLRRERPDAVILDIMMPHMSGLEILAAMQAD